MRHKKWLSELKAGDRVVVHGRYEKCVKSVKKITKTMIVLENDK